MDKKRPWRWRLTSILMKLIRWNCKHEIQKFIGRIDIEEEGCLSEAYINHFQCLECGKVILVESND